MPFIVKPKDEKLNRCLSPDHNPPSMIVLEPGYYEYMCPTCHKVTCFTINGVTM